MDRPRHPHTHVIILSVQKCLDMKNSSIPNVLQRRRTTAAGLPEVVAPFSHTVGLIHTHQGQGHGGGESLQQHCAVQPLWGHIQHPQPACLHQSHVSFVVPPLVGGRCHMGCGCHGVRCLSAAKGGMCNGRKVGGEKGKREQRLEERQAGGVEGLKGSKTRGETGWRRERQKGRTA